MFATGVNWTFTVVFVLTGAYALVRALGHARARPAGAPLAREDVVELGHLAMSVVMVVMVWTMPSGVIAWALAAGFVILAGSLLVGGTGEDGGRVALAAHVSLAVAMAWMVLAMPQLMSGSAMGGGGHHGTMAMAMPAGAASGGPAGWISVLNVIAVVVCAAAGVWFLWALSRARRGDAPHLVCHLAMAGGMAAMLVAMA